MQFEKNRDNSCFNNEIKFMDEIVNRLELSNEIHSLIEAGYEVTIGHMDDKAYDDPKMIKQVFEALDKMGKKFDRQSHHLLLRHLGILSIDDADDSQLQKAYVQNEAQIEEIRTNLLFDDAKMPWHIQRGSALALQTIVDAHELITVDLPSSNELKYSTMSGMLPYFDENFTFCINDGSLNGLNLKEAIADVHQRFNGVGREEALINADIELEKLNIFFCAPVTKDFKDIITNCYDSLGIRSRKQEVCKAISDHIDGILKIDPLRDNLTLLSIGCGTAQSILEVACCIRDKGINSKLILLDQNPIALAAAKSLAGEMGLSDIIEIHCERLFNQNGQLLDMTDILKGRRLDVAEDTGLREYLPDRIYCNLTKSVWGQLSEDGIMTTGNMNINRPQPEFLNGLMGWRPYVIMRNINKGFELHEKSGISKGSTKARVTRDGVYTLFYSYKKAFSDGQQSGVRHPTASD